MKKFLTIITLWLVGSMVYAQRPIINSLSKTSATVGETIIINGAGFPTNLANVQVNFGAGIATVNAVAANQIEVVVPNDATVSPVSVLDLTTGLFGISRQQFTISYGGDGFDAGQVDAQVDFPTTKNETYDICLCDFDGDNSIDVAVANRVSTEVTVFRNTSTVNTTSFTTTNIAAGITSINIECGDLNGDGLPELAVSNDQGNDDDVLVFRNTSTPGTITLTTIDLNLKLPQIDASTNRSARRVIIQDIDNDGKKDIIVGSAADPSIFVYLNTSSTGGSISVSASNQISVTGATSNTGSIAVGDMDNDGLNDIIALPFRESNSDMFFLKNISQTGSVLFETATPVGVSNRGTEVILVDLDNDRFLDIVSTDGTANRLNILRNTTSGGAVSFGTQFFKTAPAAWGVAAADFDGDGLTDLVTGNSVSGGIEVFINTSSGSITMDDAINIPTTSTVRNLKAGDLNGDGKPDFAITHRVSLGQSNSEFSALINRNCFSPTIFPTDLSFCRGNPFDLFATKTAEATYTWSITAGDASVTPAGDNASVTVNTGNSVTVQVTIVANDGSCSGGGENTGQQVFTITGGAPPTAPNISNDNTGTICSGEDFTLSGPAGQTTYFWTLPDGTELEQTTENLIISGASASDGGVYALRVQGSECVSDEGTITVVVDENPSITVANTGDDNFCSTGTVTLQVPEYDGFNHQWRNGSGDISGATSSAFEASTTDTYSVQMTSVANGCESFSNTYAITAVAPPASAFTSASEICVDTPLDLSASSTGQSGFGLTYDWDFGDGTSGRSSTTDTTHTYTASGTFTVTLTTGYANVATCTDVATFDVTVSDPAAIAITAPGGSLEKCPGDSIRLELPQNFQSYSWSTGATTYFTYAKTRNIEDEVTISVDMVTDIGCAITSEETVANFMNSRVSISSPDATISNDTISLGEGVASVTLTADNGTDPYTWTPAEILDNTDMMSVFAIPQAEYTSVTVTSADPVNGCVTTDSVVIQTPGVIARKSFSPNGDGLGFDCWEILNTSNLQGCTVYIMDERGRYVLKDNSPFDNNCVWNGNLDNGSSQAPEGIYYFILKCENSNYSQTGTILLGR